MSIRLSPAARGALFLLVAAAALAAGYLFSSGQRMVPGEVKPGAQAASLIEATFPGVDGKPQRVDQWKGKVLVVNFWATWCAPCRKEIPDLIRAQAHLGARGLQVIGVAVDDADKVRPFIHEIKINYPILIGGIDSMEFARSAGNELGALPFTVIFDRAGKPFHAELGTLDEAKLSKLIAPIL